MKKLMSFVVSVTLLSTPAVAMAKEPQPETLSVSDITAGSLRMTGKAHAVTGSNANGDYFIESFSEDSRFSQVVTIAGPDSPSEYIFSFDLPDRIHLVENHDGSVSFVDTSGEIVGSINAPWATDASGKNLPTTYTVVGDSIIQTIDLSGDIVYPVIADPEGVWGWTMCVAAVTGIIAVPVGAAIKLARFVKSIGNVKEAMQLLTGATKNQERLDAALSAAGATAGELLGITAVQESCA